MKKTNHGFMVRNDDKEVAHLIKVGRNSGYKVNVQIVSKKANWIHVEWRP